MNNFIKDLNGSHISGGYRRLKTFTSTSHTATLDGVDYNIPFKADGMAFPEVQGYRDGVKPFKSIILDAVETGVLLYRHQNLVEHQVLIKALSKLSVRLVDGYEEFALDTVEPGSEFLIDFDQSPFAILLIRGNCEITSTAKERP